MNDRRTRSHTIAILLLLAAAACSPGDGPDPFPVHAAEPAAELPGPPGAEFPTPAEWYTLQAEVNESVDSVDRVLRRIPNLSSSERRELRRDGNAVQIARATRLGIPRGTPPERHLESGRLVELEPANEYWIIRDLNHSEPYVTPATRAMLLELGERFQAKLEDAGLPMYRFEVTSILRTPEHQAELRRSNPNAARGVSAHEFGTTVDIAYRRFAPPGDSLALSGREIHPDAVSLLKLLNDHLLEETAAQRGTELQAILGRALLEMRDEGRALVIMEGRQTVYHITVARG